MTNIYRVKLTVLKNDTELNSEYACTHQSRAGVVCRGDLLCHAHSMNTCVFRKAGCHILFLVSSCFCFLVTPSEQASSICAHHLPRISVTPGAVCRRWGNCIDRMTPTIVVGVFCEPQSHSVGHLRPPRRVSRHTSYHARTKHNRPPSNHDITPGPLSAVVACSVCSLIGMGQITKIPSIPNKKRPGDRWQTNQSSTW